MSDSASLRRDNIRREWICRLADRLLRVDDETLSAIAKMLDMPESARAFAQRARLTWPDATAEGDEP